MLLLISDLLPFVPTGRDTTNFSSGGPYLENERYSFYEISHTVGIYHGGEPRKILARTSAAKKQRGHPPCLGRFPKALEGDDFPTPFGFFFPFSQRVGKFSKV